MEREAVEVAPADLVAAETRQGLTSARRLDEAASRWSGHEPDEETDR